jgi:cysteine desulfurase
VMAANNEIGVLQPMEEIGRCCRERGVVFHSDATQAVGKIPVDVDRWQVDLMSFSGHKVYGPKGIGALFIRRRAPRVRLESQIDGGRQEFGFRSGTANVPGIVGLAKALELCSDEGPDENSRLAHLRNHLYHGLRQRIPGILLNGPALQLTHLRLSGNLNCCFGDVDGEALMMNVRDLALSSGSACSSADPTPSHVLQALGLDADQTRSSLRFGLGRFNTMEQVEIAIQSVAAAVHHLRQLHGPDQT